MQRFVIIVTCSPFVLSPSTPLILSLSKDERRSGQACRRYILSLSKGRTRRSWFDEFTTSGEVTVIAQCVMDAHNLAHRCIASSRISWKATLADR